MLHFATENFALVARTIAPVSKVVSIYNIYIIENYSPHCVSLFMGFSYFVLFLLLIFHGIAELLAICLCIMFGGDWKWENIAIYLVLPESVLVFASCHHQPPVPPTAHPHRRAAGKSEEGKTDGEHVTDNMLESVRWCARVWDDDVAIWIHMENLSHSRSFTFSPASGGEGKNEFSKCVILYAQFDIFSIHFDCFRFSRSAFLSRHPPVVGVRVGWW